MQRRVSWVWASAALALLGCSAGEPGFEDPVASVAQPVAPPTSAYCTANVTGKGPKAAEDDYLPHVITCENGGAGLEALKAQAIAARSVLYYNMATQGSICDSQGCQVYSCGAAPQAKHYQAVKETAGMYLSYAGMLTYGFFVAGDSNASAPSCKDYSGSTTKYVTYNEGKTGGSVTQTSLGYIGPPGYGQNRGCMGQWGARCLENQKGYKYMDILRFYYGADIQVKKATGSCVGGCEPTGCEGSKLVSACGKGDCAAYGATCVHDSKGPRCVSVFCPPTGTKKVCLDDKIIGDCKDGGISTGDCSVYGAKCVDDNLGARCVSVFCPNQGTAKSCLDDSQIIDCKDGAITGSGDCAAYGAFCSTAGSQEAHCASVFCVSDPNEVPIAHDVCLPDGRFAHCDEQGGLTDVSECEGGEACVSEGEAHCPGDVPNSGGQGGGGQAGGAAGEAGGASGGAASGGSGSEGPGKQRTQVLEDDGGCSVGRAGGGREGPWLWLFGLVAWLGLRRKA